MGRNQVYTLAQTYGCIDEDTEGPRGAVKRLLSRSSLAAASPLETRTADWYVGIFPGIVQPIPFQNIKYLHLEFGSALRVSAINFVGSCLVVPTLYVFGEPALLHSHFIWFGKVGTHAFSLTSGTGIDPRLVNSEFLPSWASGLVLS